MPDSAEDKRLGPIISVRELLSRLSTEFRNADLLPALQRAKVRARLAAEMRELHAVFTWEQIGAYLKEKHPEAYRELFEEGRV